MQAIGLGVDAGTTAIGQRALAGDCTLACHADLASLTGCAARTTVVAVLLQVGALAGAEAEASVAHGRVPGRVRRNSAVGEAPTEIGASRRDIVIAAGGLGHRQDHCEDNGQ